MKKLFIILLSLVLAHLSISASMAENVYAYIIGIEYTERLPCPEVHLETLIDNELEVRTAEALTRWFIAENAFRENWYHQFWNHEAVILTEPYIIEADEDEYGDVTVYCFACITAYALFRGDDGALYLAEDDSELWLFRVALEDPGDPDWWIDEVYRIDSMDEELYPGAGYGTQGFPGLTDDLIGEIPDRYWSAKGIAQRYLEMNGIDATIVAW